jgi:D-sedoheptulose 7-phosphate isomerase
MSRREPLPTARAHVGRLVEVLQRLGDDDLARVERWGRHLAAVLAHDGRLLACGNGGSAADAQHLTAELVGRYRDDRRPFSAIALTAETSSLTAIANDYGYEEVFARQVRAHARPGDVLIAISTSGTSSNVVAACEAARQRGVRVWSLTGPGRSLVADRSDESIRVDALTTATVQEVHGVLIHAMCAAVDRWVLADAEDLTVPADVLRVTASHRVGS